LATKKKGSLNEVYTRYFGEKKGPKSPYFEGKKIKIKLPYLDNNIAGIQKNSNVLSDL
jgi:hypothetical protein